MADAALRHTMPEAHGQDEPNPLRVDREGIALLRDRLRESNTSNPEFELRQRRLFAVLDEALRRLQTEFAGSIERVVAVGDWARYGLDLRNLPFDDVVLLIVLRERERPFSLYLQIADRVFTDLGDEDILVQFRVATLQEWRAGTESAQQRGAPEALGILLLARGG
ncbi:MAG: hypothetical protein H0T18_06935 [Chloroflexia bacterium]|nr:hypothetical protein [Chloroflexia bacterium]